MRSMTEGALQAPPITRRRAKALRQTLTLPEGLLWRAIKGRRFDRLHIRRQHPIGPYVLDFYCHSARLCIEVDGYAHGTGDQPLRDARRDRWLAQQGIRTLRLRAGLVLEDVDVALGMIRSAVAEAPSVTLRVPPPPEGEELD